MKSSSRMKNMLKDCSADRFTAWIESTQIPRLSRPKVVSEIKCELIRSTHLLKLNYRAFAMRLEKGVHELLPIEYKK